MCVWGLSGTNRHGGAECGDYVTPRQPWRVPEKVCSRSICPRTSMRRFAESRPSFSSKCTDVGKFLPYINDDRISTYQVSHRHVLHKAQGAVLHSHRRRCSEDKQGVILAGSFPLFLTSNECTLRAGEEKLSYWYTQPSLRGVVPYRILVPV